MDPFADDSAAAAGGGGDFAADSAAAAVDSAVLGLEPGPVSPDGVLLD